MRTIIKCMLFCCITMLGCPALAQDATGWQPVVVKLDDYKVAPPPGKDAEQSEISKVLAYQSRNQKAYEKEITYWHAGPPAYRWMQLSDHLFDTSQYWVRTNAYTAVAIYDATLAARKAQLKYQRKRPFEISDKVKARVLVSSGLSYPCEYAVSAAAAAAVLGHFYPDKKDSLLQLAQKAGQSRIAAGLAYPSDVEAGFELGTQVAQRIIEYAATDGYSNPWPGSLPKGREYYTGKPIRKDLPNMRTWILKSPSQFRSPAPPPIQPDMDSIRSHTIDPYTKYQAFRWEFSWPWGEEMEKKVLEYNLASDPVKGAFAYALVAMSDYDNQVAHWDGKYTYYRARPDQWDSTYSPLFPTPASPSYPAGHGTMSYTRAAVMSFLFPYDQEHFYRLAEECNNSRFDAGVHYKTDNRAGEELGRKVGSEIVNWAKKRMPK